MPSRVKVQELHVGEGEVAERHDIVTIRHEGTLRRGERFGGGIETIDLGRRETIAGLRHGIEGMRVGGRRRITVGPHLAYGQAGVPGVELVEVIRSLIRVPEGEEIRPAEVVSTGRRLRLFTPDDVTRFVVDYDESMTRIAA